MTTTSFYNGNSFSKFDAYYEECEHDDEFTADDYERKAYIQDGWIEAQFDRQRW